MNKLFSHLILVFMAGLVLCVGSAGSKGLVAAKEETKIVLSDKKQVAHANNMVCYDYLLNRETEFYFENYSYEETDSRVQRMNPQQDGGALKNSSSTYNGWARVSDVSSDPNRWVAYLIAGNKRGTAFFIGPNLLLTAGHCVMRDNYSFATSIRIRPGFDSMHSSSAPKDDIVVNKVYVSKRYKTARFEDDGDKNGYYDWAVLEVQESDELTNWLGGWFGKACNYRATGTSMKTVGYPSITSSVEMWKNDFVVTGVYDADDPSNGTVLSFNRPAYGGASGSPVYVYDGAYYATAILTSAASSGVLINDFIYRFTNSLLANRYIEVRDHWFDSNMSIRYYNCIVETIVKPDDQNAVYLFKEGSTSGTRYQNLTKVFNSTSSSSTLGDGAYTSFKLRNKKTGVFSETYRISDFFSEDEMSAAYKTIGRTKNGKIAKTFDSTGNVWDHHAPIGSKIKGSIVCGGESRNIECSVPWIGYSSVSSVECGGVTFYLRAGPNKVSIRAESEVETGSSSFFAFGRE